MTPLIHRPDIVQLAWVVPDLEAAMRHWHAVLGVGPFLVNRRIPLGSPRHRGQPMRTAFSTALAQSGDMQIELVEQHDDTPSAYRDTVPAGATAFHHVAIIVQDYAAEMARFGGQGFETAGDGLFGEMHFAYVDTAATLGHMIEVIEDKAAIRAFFAAVRQAGESWDGNPDTLIREMAR